jgi:iron uptake system EfeUOB component EfeO/EfeM
MSLIYNTGLCAKCNRNLKTNIQSRQKITLQWMRSLIKLLNDDDTNMNEYVCCKCYFELSKYKFNDGFKEFTESVKKEEKEVKEEI